MLREIKFRYWNIKNKAMLPDEDITNFRYLNPSLYNIDFIIPMQYTGLKDKNGKEIYEGDIMKIDGQIYSIYWNELHAGYWIKRHPRDFSGTWNMIYVSTKGEVIGNIYKNPELLGEGR